MTATKQVCPSVSGITNPCGSAAGRKRGGGGATVLSLFNNALVNSSGTERQCGKNPSYPLEPTALNLRAVAWSIAQTLGLLTASLEHKHTGDWESCFSACPPWFLPGCFRCLFIFKQVVYMGGGGHKKNPKKHQKTHTQPKNHIAFLINTSFLPGPYDPLLIPIKMLFFFFAPSADRISDQPGYATNLPAQLNPTDSERSKGLMHSLKFSTAQAGSLMQDLPLHCN